MSEYLHVEKHFLDQLGMLAWTVIDQVHDLLTGRVRVKVAESEAALASTLVQL